jgi:hypothetical protein
MGLGLSPETVDNGFNTEFATTAVANNVLLSKRVVMWQNEFCPQLTQHLRQHARFSEGLIKDLHHILEQNQNKILLEIEKTEGVEINEEMKSKLLVDYALRRFLDTFKVELPQPSSVTLQAQAEDLKEYAEMLDMALEAYVTADMFGPDTAGDLSTHMVALKSMLKAYFLRKWMAEKGILPELGEIISVDTEGGEQANIVTEIQSHIEAITKAGVTALVKLSANRIAATKDLKGTDTPEGQASSVGGFSSAGGGFGGGTDFGGGLDGLGGGDDLGGFSMGGDDSPSGGAEGSTTEEQPSAGEDSQTGSESADGKTGDDTQEGGAGTAA